MRFGDRMVIVNSLSGERATGEKSVAKATTTTDRLILCPAVTLIGSFGTFRTLHVWKIYSLSCVDITIVYEELFQWKSPFITPSGFRASGHERQRVKHESRVHCIEVMGAHVSL